MRAWADSYAAAAEFIGPDGAAWLGMDGPVPGVMTAEIELLSPDLDTPAYRYFGELGFTRPYVRTHWTRL